MCMKKWLRSVVPDLVLAAVVALLVTVAINQLDGRETRRIRADSRAAARGGLTLDERINVVDGSIRRSTLLHLPVLITLSAVIVGLASSNSRWAWLTAIGSVLPALIMGIAFFVDRPIPASFLVTAYLALAVSMTLAGAALRRLLVPVRTHSD
jgi:hypothetical protein